MEKFSNSSNVDQRFKFKIDRSMLQVYIWSNIDFETIPKIGHDSFCIVRAATKG